MELWKLIVYVAVGFIGGGCMGWVLGVESPRRCRECLSSTESRYAAGHQAGYRDGVVMTLERVRKLGVEAKSTYTITKSELERIGDEVAEV